MTGSFEQQRRQQFLTQPYWSAHSRWLSDSVRLWRSELPHGDTEEQRRSLAAALVASDAYELLSLRYTAGAPFEELRRDLNEVVEAYERYQQALGVYEQSPQMSPLGLDQLGDYERAMQILGLCILLHRPDLLKRMAALIDPGYKGEDTLYEDLLAFYEPGRIELDEWYHEKPYTTLVHAMYEQDKAEAARKLKVYCDEWYASFKYVPWHDGHLRIDGTEGDYFGYWAFEAGAVALLYDIDDSGITHMVYPRDLVAWSRANRRLKELEAGQPGEGLRVEAGQPCPREGWWLTPAKADSRRHFLQGEVMPAFTTDYGATIWQWDEHQQE